MVEVGSLELVGRLDVGAIKFGLNEMKRGLEEAKTAAKSAFGDIERIGGSVSRIARPLAIAGAGIVAFFTTLATMAPQAAPHLERMKTDFFRLSTIIGEHLEPVISMLADAFGSFVDWIGSPQGRGVLEEVKGIMLALGGAIKDTIGNLTDIAKDWTMGFDIDIGEGLKWLIETFGPELVAAIIGWKLGGPAGAAIAAGGIAVVRGGEGIMGAAKRVGGAALLGAGVGAAIGSIIPGAGTAAGAAVGGVAGAAFALGGEIWRWIAESMDMNEKEMYDWNNFKNAHTGG